jgi:hypothetical protein
MEKLVRELLKAEEFMRSRPEETQNLVAEWLRVDVSTELEFPTLRYCETMTFFSRVFRTDMLQKCSVFT